jgi:uncharacterized LabA/DUF88 family protein
MKTSTSNFSRLPKKINIAKHPCGGGTWKEREVSNMDSYAFIDSQNLHLGIHSLGWELDYRKFRLYLKNKYNVAQAFLFIGYVAENQILYSRLQQAGFVLIFKPVVKFTAGNRQIVKGNVDAELVLHAAAIEFENYDKAVIVTNDGDFACLLRYLNDKDKLHRIITPNTRYSSLFRPFSSAIVTLENMKAKLCK